MNEKSTVLLLLIVGVWFFTNARSQAFLSVIKSVSPSNSNSVTAATTPPVTEEPKQVDPFKTPSLENGVGV